MNYIDFKTINVSDISENKKKIFYKKTNIQVDKNILFLYKYASLLF